MSGTINYNSKKTKQVELKNAKGRTRGSQLRCSGTQKEEGDLGHPVDN